MGASGSPIVLSPRTDGTYQLAEASAIEVCAIAVTDTTSVFNFSISSLLDVPDYTGESGKFLKVNPADGQLIWSAGAGGGVTTFIALEDTPPEPLASHIGQVVFASGADSLGFSSLSFSALPDTPATYVGQSGKHVIATTEGLVFSSVPNGILDLSDTPDSWGTDLQALVKAAGIDALIWSSITGGGSTTGIGSYIATGISVADGSTVTHNLNGAVIVSVYDNNDQLIDCDIEVIDSNNVSIQFPGITLNNGTIICVGGDSGAIYGPSETEDASKRYSMLISVY